MFDLSGKTALVTGANTGLGQAMAIALAQAGADIALIGRTPATETLNDIAKTGVRSELIFADLGDASTISKIVPEVIEKFGRADILVNNAGTIKRNAALELTPDQWDSVMDVNLRAVFFLCQVFAKQAVDLEQPGKIINIASMLSFQGGVRVPSYTASKSGVSGLTRALANEWAQYGINVNAIAPGYFDTNNTAALKADKKRNAEILGRIPSGRWGQPSDLAGAIVFLASNASDYVQGITLPVDGGWLSR
ncbi:2-dehydro-3-deoxy-D-gluconate 5-dehydrogenase KduD [Parasphingorhabdus sp.]|uniref:2-dehydro-3-deoxy-D-gluconate 5-dehydrogenase KduD n=1 Tax=Parasphingorhabdus sp. TaxID=2709688 RepID=UPI0032633EEF